MKKTKGFQVFVFLLTVCAYLGNMSRAHAYTSLITSSDFTGVTADVVTAVGGVITVALILLGAGLLLKVIMGR
jgi:hypothetical protein